MPLLFIDYVFKIRNALHHSFAFFGFIDFNPEFLTCLFTVFASVEQNTNQDPWFRSTVRRFHSERFQFELPVWASSLVIFQLAFLTEE